MQNAIVRANLGVQQAEEKIEENYLRRFRACAWDPIARVMCVNKGRQRKRSAAEDGVKEACGKRGRVTKRKALEQDR